MNEPVNQPNQGEAPEGAVSGTIAPEEVRGIASRADGLVRAGEASQAWEVIRRLHPADIGSVLTALPRNSRDAIFQAMGPDTLAWILRQMNPVQAGRFAARIGSRTIGAVLNQVHPWQAIDAMRRIFPWQANQVASQLDQPVAAPEIVVHASNTAGTLMVSDYPTVNLENDSQEALESLRALADIGYKFTHVFAIDENDVLAGQVSIVDLALSPVDTPVRSLVYPVVTVAQPATSLEECARLRLHYNLQELPVEDEAGRLVGVIPGEFLMTATVEQDTRQMLRVNNVGGENPAGPLTGSIKTRLPWLTINLGTTFLAAGAISLFEGLLAQVVVLAIFLPVVAGQGGIGGTQTLTLIVRGIALGELAGIAAYRLLLREALLGLIHGICLGVLVAVIAVVWKQNPALGIVLGLAMMGNMVIAGIAGAAVPLFLRRVGVDPAVASAVIVTTFTDVLGFLLFLGIAASALSFLV